MFSTFKKQKYIVCHLLPHPLKFICPTRISTIIATTHHHYTTYYTATIIAFAATTIMASAIITTISTSTTNATTLPPQLIDTTALLLSSPFHTNIYYFSCKSYSKNYFLDKFLQSRPYTKIVGTLFFFFFPLCANSNKFVKHSNLRTQKNQQQSTSQTLDFFFYIDPR